MFKLYGSARTNLESLRKSGKELSERLIELVYGYIEVSPLDFTLVETSGFRYPEQQKELFDLGYSKCDGTSIRSQHQSGLAVDLVPWINGEAVWDKDYGLAIAIGFKVYCDLKGYKVRLGADWNGDGIINNKKGEFFDPCHIELVGRL